MGINYEDTVDVQLTRAQALVLLEWLVTQSGNAAMGALPFEDAAERKVLLALEGKLETALLEKFSRDYNDRVEVAREIVRGMSS